MRTTGRVAVVLGLAVATLLFVSTPAYSQNFSDLDAAENVFEDFASGVAGALPLNSSIGLNWSSAHIGQTLGFPPRFGIGLTMGATTLPYSALKSAVDDLGADDLGDVPFAEALGLPIAGYTVDARIGGFILPFDIGLKVGGIPSGTSIPVPGLGSVDMDYLLLGGDVRYRVVEENLVLPTVSVGVGFNYLRGKIGVEGVLGDVEIASVAYDDGGSPQSVTVFLTDPALEFEWESKVLDFKVQASKDILVLTPYLGLGASYAWSEAGGGVRTRLEVDGGNETVRQAIIDQYDQFDTDGFGVSSSVQGFGVRTFGGFSFNVLIARLDFTLMYDFLGQNIGATTGARIQL